MDAQSCQYLNEAIGYITTGAGVIGCWMVLWIAFWAVLHVIEQVRNWIGR